MTEANVRRQLNPLGHLEYVALKNIEPGQELRLQLNIQDPRTKPTWNNPGQGKKPKKQQFLYDFPRPKSTWPNNKQQQDKAAPATPQQGP